MKKRKANKKILKAVSVSIDEIKANNYNLSPSYWINKKSAIN